MCMNLPVRATWHQIIRFPVQEDVYLRDRLFRKEKDGRAANMDMVSGDDFSCSEKSTMRTNILFFHFS